MDAIIEQKYQNEDLNVEFEILPVAEVTDISDPRQREIIKNINELDNRIDIIQAKVDELNVDIERLTNSADGLDYMVAVASGMLAGAIDSFWVGEFSIDRANEWGNEKTNNFVVKIAKMQGYDSDDLEGAIRFLENKYHLASDSNTSDFGGGKQHHLRDFAHHPTIVGLIFSLLTQFTGNAYGTDTKGCFKIVPVANQALIGKNIPEKILFGTVFWFFHMISDMAGSSSTPGKGTGLPGPLVSLLKELSALPFFKNLKIDGTDFSVWISKLFNGTLLGKRDADGNIVEGVKFDLRTELGVVHELGRQAVPVIINEVIVRAFYFVRRFCNELKEKKISSFNELKTDVDWNKVLPFKNRTIVRMVTIASGTFEVIDLADAAIRSAVKSGGVNAPAFVSNMLLSVNFVGLGRFVIAVGTDVGMGIKKGRLENERIKLHEEQIALTNAKVFYKQANMWIAAESTGESIQQAYEYAEKSAMYFAESMVEIQGNIDKIGDYVPDIKKKNPGLIEDLLKELEW